MGSSACSNIMLLIIMYTIITLQIPFMVIVVSVHAAMMSSLALLVSLILFSSPVLPQSVAPGDADPYCLTRPTRISTFSNEKILLDSQDYRSTRLLGVTGGNVTWLTIDYDGGGSGRIPASIAFLDAVSMVTNCTEKKIWCLDFILAESPRIIF